MFQSTRTHRDEQTNETLGNNDINEAALHRISNKIGTFHAKPKFTGLTARSGRKPLFFLVLLLVTAILQAIEIPAAYAEDGLRAGSQARVSNTDGDGVRLRESPAASAATISTLGETWTVTVLDGPFKDNAGNSFYKVEWAGRVGYVMTQYLSRSNTGGFAAGSQVRVTGTDGDGVIMRSQAKAGTGAVATLGENYLATVQAGPFKDDNGNSFYKIEWTGKVGYVSAQYLIYAGNAAPPSSSTSTGNSKRSGPFRLNAGMQARVVRTDGEGVRLRQQPTSSASTLNVLGETYLVTITGGPYFETDDIAFYKVEWTGYTGFISSTFLDPAGNNAVAGTGGYVRVTGTDGDPVRFRSGAGRSFGSNSYVYEGQVFKLLAGPMKDSDGTNWYKVEKNGEIGYIDGTFITRTNNPTPVAAPVASKKPVSTPSVPAEPKKIPAPPTNGPLGSRISTFALEFVGYRYVWGGSSPEVGFDCSGFVHYVLDRNGIDSGHSVDSDLAIGQPVALEDLQPGDILIWANTYKPGPSHSGIYIGGGRFVHAATESTGVTINNLSESYYASRFYAARRPGV